MPVPEQSLEKRLGSAELRLAQAAVDLNARDAYIEQLIETIHELDQQIADLTSNEGKSAKAKS